MAIANSIGLTAEDIKDVSFLDEVLKDAELQECGYYSSSLRKYTKRTTIESQAKITQFLSTLCSFSFMRDDNDDMYLQSGSYDMEELIDNNDIVIIKDIITKIKCPELLARLYDICWTRKKEHSIISELIDNYFKTIQNLISSSWIYPIYRFKRLITIVRKTNHRERETEFLEFIIEQAKVRKIQQPDFFISSLIEFLNKYKTRDKDLLILCEQYAKEFLEQKRFHEASIYFDTLSNIYLSLKEYDKSKEIIELYVETKVVESEECIKSEESYFKASQILAPAVERYKSVGNKEKYDELHQMLIEYQKKGMSEFETIEYKIDLSEVIETYNSVFENLDFKKSVIEFAKHFISPTKEHIDNYLEQKKQNVFINFASKQKVDSDGRVVGVGASAYDDKEEERYKKQGAFEFLDYHWSTACSTIIRIFLTHINLVPYERSDIEELVNGNPLVEPGREIYFIDGLLEGLKYHFSTSLHLLVPQIENMFRFILKNQGKIVTKLKDGIQDEMDINDILNSSELRPVLEEIIGDTIVLDLEAVLVGRWGMNLRNKLAHGLITYNDTFSDASVYFILLVMKLIVCGWLYNITGVEK